MITSDNGLKLIESSEGFRATVYLDIRKILTIGYGRKVLSHEEFTAPLTEDEAQVLLSRDVQWAEKIVGYLVHVPLNQNQFDSLVDFVYNVGAGSFAKSSILVKINAKEYDAVPAVILEYDHAGQIVSEGLERRRQAEIALWKLAA